MFKNIFIKIKKTSKLKFCCSSKFIFTVFFSFVFLFIVAVPAHAQLEGVGKAIVIGLGWVAYGFAWVVGEIMILVVDVLIKVASINNFINVPVVKTGWVIVRDLSNMFFILVLLIIAFATILRIESYSMKRWLPKLLIMAVLINFSKTICGLIIDFSQVIMLTFVSSFSAHGPANLIDLFKVEDYLSLSNITDDKVGTLAVMGGIIAGLIAFIVTLIVLLVMLAILIMRVILLWIYVILSPIAFLASSFPAGQKYSSQWWSEFIKQVIVGPVLAFFLWLALTTAQQSSSIFEKVDISGNASINGVSTNFCAGAGASLLCSARFIEYIVVIGLLVGGLIVTQQVGAAAGAAAGRGMAAIKKGQALGVKGQALGVKGLKKSVSVPIGYGVDKLHQKAGIDLNLARVWRGVQEERQRKKRDMYQEGVTKAGEALSKKSRFRGLLSMTGTPHNAWDQLTSLKGLKQRFWIKDMAGKRETLQKERDKKLSKLEDLKEKRFNFITEDAKEKIKKQITINASKMSEIQEKIGNKKRNIEKMREKGVEESEIKKEEKELEGLEKQRSVIENRISSDKKKLKARVVKKGDKDYEEMMKLDQDIQSTKKEIEQTNRKISKVTPIYDYEGRVADQSLVNEEINRLQGINNAEELKTILYESIERGQKYKVKAALLKMAQNGDDNEFLQLIGRTDYVGLQAYMRALSGKIKDKDLVGADDELKDFIVANRDQLKDLNAGFSDTEAKNLGSQIAMANRSVNHWSSTGAYIMKDGEWKESNRNEHGNYVGTETSKIYPQAIVRNFNRLAFGYHDINNDFHISVGGVRVLQNLDNDVGIENVKRQMNINAARLMAGRLDQLNKLVEKGIISQRLVDAILERSKSETEEELAAVDHSEILSALELDGEQPRNN